MKHIYLMLSLFFALASVQAQTLVVNEFSQGTAGTDQEYIELVVVGKKTCYDSTLDLRNWIIDDNNNWYTNNNTSIGYIRFRDISAWSAIPYGAVILIYNDNDKNPKIPADDITDANNDGIYIIPISSDLFETNFIDATYSTNSANYTINSTSTNSWSVISLGDDGDAVIVVNPNNYNIAEFAIAYGTNAVGTQLIAPTVNILTGGIGGEVYYNDDSLYHNVNSWIGVGILPTNETPGFTNTTNNGNWINGMFNELVPTRIIIRDTFYHCVNQLPYTWRGINVNYFGDSVATKTKGFCDTLFILHLNPLYIDSTILSENVCPKDLPFNWYGQTINTPGPHTLRHTLTSVNKGCDSILILNVNILSNSYNTFSQSICAEELPFIYLGDTINTTGNFHFVDTFVAANGCDSIITFNLFVKQTPIVNLSDEVCFNKLPYFWNNHIVTTSGNHYLYDTTKSADGCDSITILSLKIKNENADTLSYNVCYDDLPFLFNHKLFRTPGYHKLEYTNIEGCDSNIVLFINLSSMPYEASVTFNGCDSVEFKGRWYNKFTVLNDTLINSYGCDSVYRKVYLVIYNSYIHRDTAYGCELIPYEYYGKTFSTAGLHTVIFNTTSGCDSIFELMLHLSPAPSVKLDIDSLGRYCIGDTLVINYSGATEFVWEPNPLYNTGSQVGIKLKDFENNINILADNFYGCEEQSTLTINAEKCCDYNVPNAFTPNNDGLNDVFHVIAPGHSEIFKLSIYDRYGRRVFLGNSQYVGWDGTYMGQPLPVGTYYYILEFTCNNETLTTKGDVTLLR